MTYDTEHWRSQLANWTPDLRPLAAGERLDVACNQSFERVRPFDGEALPPIAHAGPEAIDTVVKSSAGAFTGAWNAIPPMGKRQLLLSLADQMLAAREELALADCAEMGKPISAALMEVEIAAGFVRFYAEAIDKFYGYTAPGSAGTLETHQRVPRGVVAAITPWNFPLINAALKCAPALAAGNTVVLKPSEYACASALKLGELALAAGLPPGVLNVLPGTGTAGAALCAHPDVDLVSFTGSNGSGRAVLQAAGGDSLRPAHVECGGKCPQIVFADVIDNQLEAVTGALVQAAMMNQGQVCIARSRLLVQASVYEQVLEAVTAGCAALKPSSSLDPATIFGPLATPAQFEKTRTYIDIGVEEGARLVLDGRSMEKPPGKGFYLGPSIFADVAPEHRIARDEIFGPVLSVMRFETPHEAIALANDSQYGLAASVWTRDMSTAHSVADALKAGWVTVNARPASPMEGSAFAHAHEPAGQSGFGAEGGLQGLDSYTRLKSTSFTY